MESQNREWFGVYSNYANAFWFAMESANPRPFTREFIVFRRDGRSPKAVIPLGSLTAVYGMPPCISSNGLAVAIRSNRKVQVFRLKK